MNDAFTDDDRHECADGTIVNDADLPTETNEHGDRWCSRCGERILAVAVAWVEAIDQGVAVTVPSVVTGPTGKVS